MIVKSSGLSQLSGVKAAGETSTLSRRRRLVVVSNRAPVKISSDAKGQRVEPTVGGLGSTFARLLEASGGVWIAWSGSKWAPERLGMPLDEPRYTIVFPKLTDRDIKNYYYGVCNLALWPLMHSMHQYCHFSSSQWSYYQRVNRVFAETVKEEAVAGDVVWIQDFHLALVPRLLRESRPDFGIGMFWHVPFPPQEIFRIFPWREEFLAGMLGCDLIGFHTDEYVSAFLSACERVLGAAVDHSRMTVTYRGHITRARCFSLGIDALRFSQLASLETIQQKAQKIRQSLGVPTVVLGVDRLDYTKGIPERLLGFEQFLERYPQFRRQLTLVQIAVPSRTEVRAYKLLRSRIEELVGRIVGRFSSEKWSPVRYLYTQFGIEDLVAYYLAADIALLTPLRDGMNLVSKEYVASRIDEDGVLILSEFAGAADELSEALIVNPYDIDQIAECLKNAVEMDRETRAAHMRQLRQKVISNDLDHWSDSFVRALNAEAPVEGVALASASAN